MRDISPAAERERLDRSRIAVVEWRDGRPVTDPLGALDRVAGRVREVYLHVDLDAFSPEVAPGVVDRPVPGGLSRIDAESIIAATGQRFRIRAATLATYTPSRDRLDTTLHTARRVLGAISEALVSSDEPPG